MILCKALWSHRTLLIGQEVSINFLQQQPAPGSFDPNGRFLLPCFLKHFYIVRMYAGTCVHSSDVLTLTQDDFSVNPFHRLFHQGKDFQTKEFDQFVVMWCKPHTETSSLVSVFKKKCKNPLQNKCRRIFFGPDHAGNLISAISCSSKLHFIFRFIAIEWLR